MQVSGLAWTGHAWNSMLGPADLGPPVGWDFQALLLGVRHCLAGATFSGQNAPFWSETGFGVPKWLKKLDRKSTRLNPVKPDLVCRLLLEKKNLLRQLLFFHFTPIQ